MAGPGVLAVLAGLVGGGWLGYAGRLVGAIDHSFGLSCFGIGRSFVIVVFARGCCSTIVLL